MSYVLNGFSDAFSAEGAANQLVGTIAVWVKPANGGAGTVAGKFLTSNTSGSENNWEVENAIPNANCRWETGVSVVAGLLDTGVTWQLIIGLHNGTAQRQVYLDGNLGNLNTTARGGGVDNYGIGYRRAVPSPGQWYGGKIAEVCFWDGVVLSQADCDFLYNGGAGRPYDELTAQASNIVWHRRFDTDITTGLAGADPTAVGSPVQDNDHPFSYAPANQVGFLSANQPILGGY